MTTNLELAPADTQIDLRIDPKFRVEKAASTLHDLAIMTGGRVAAGHGQYIDQKTLTTGLEAINAAGGQLRAAIKHPSMLDRLAGRADRVMEMPGFFSDFRIDGNKLVAGKFEFFDTFKTKNPDAVATILEMAEKTPKLFGLSAELQGQLAYVATDGTEYAVKIDPETRRFSNPPPGIELSNASLPTLRIKHLGFAAFVDQPAANDGLFAKLSSIIGDAFGMPRDTASLERVMIAFSQALESTALHTPPVNKDSTVSLSTMDIIKTIKAEFGADKAKFSQAMTLLGEQPDITIEALKAGMVQAELSSVRSELASLTALLASERDASKLAIAALTTERDDFKTKFQKIKDSGYMGLDLGSTTVTAGDENPWAAETYNYTRQTQIVLSDPARAAVLQAAAAAKK